MSKLKQLLQILISKKVIIPVAVVIILLSASFFYYFIPSPSIDDGYLTSETRKVSYTVPITIHFSQPMIKGSVEEGFKIEPALKGKFSWSDNKTLQYTPEKKLNINDQYKITIKSNARSFYLKKLGINLSLNFVVTGAPYVKFVSPMEDSTGSTTGTLIIPNNQVITVMFDRPVRALTTIDESKTNQIFPKIEITPTVKGTYRWVGTTAFQFVPEKWTMGTTYALKIPKGITTLDGGKTEKEVIWKLVTEEPKILSSFPVQNDDTFSVKGEISLNFNQPIELGDVAPGTNVLLYPSNDLDANKNPKKDGFFNTEVTYGKDKDGKTDKSILAFKPEFDYQYDKSYKLTVKSGLRNADYKSGYGDRKMSQDFTLAFKTVKKPGIASFKPVNGDQNYKGTGIQISFTSPITKDLIKNNLSLSPKPSAEPDIYVYKATEKTGTVWIADISYSLDPSTSYSFEFKGPFKDSLGNSAVNGFKTSFKTAPKESYLSLFTKGNVGLFMYGLNPFYTIKSVNINQADLKLCNITEQEFFNIDSQYGWYKYNCTDENPLTKTISVKGVLNKTNLLNLDLAEIFNTTFKQGIYFFQVSSIQYKDDKNEPYHFYQTFFVSDTNLTLKKSGSDLLVWATDLKTGKPVPQMKLKIMSYDGKELDTGVTDKNGVYKTSDTFSDNIYVIGEKITASEDRFAIINQYWNSGIEIWQYDATSGDWVGGADEPRVYLYTERPIYRPGDDILFKGIYRIDNDLKLSLPKDSKIRLALEDSEYNAISTQDLSVLSDGSFNGSFKLSDKAGVGRYNLYAETIGSKSSQRFYHNFFVEEYKKPKFKVETLGGKTDYAIGDNIAVDLKANYYFGGALKSGGVSWTLMREPYVFSNYKGSDYYSFGKWGDFHCFWDSCESSTEIASEGKGTLDQNGSLSLKLATSNGKESGQSYLYTLNASVTNKDGEVVSNRETFIVHQGSYYIGLNVKNYIVAPDESLKLRVITVTPDSKAVSGKKINLELYLEKWNTVKKKGVDGAFYDESVKELVFVTKKTVTTSSNPIDTEFKIDSNMSGSYVIYAKAQEGKNQIFSETNFYVSSSAFTNWGSSNNNQMEIVPDQPQYFVGGKARLLIKSPYESAIEPAKALVTYERGSIKYYEVIDIKSNSDVIEVPIKEDMIPNIYITVLVVKGPGASFDKFVAKDLSGQNIDFNSVIKPDFKLGIANLSVSKRDREITISLKPNQTSYKTGETVEVEIRTTDYQNRPVQSVVSLAVVDESLLALKANKKISPLDYFYGDRSLQVTTSTGLSIHAERVNVNSQNGGKGGGGGGDTEFDKKRGDFKDTAYFNPLIKTDTGGYAKIKFLPPDNLTTWEMWAVASGGTDKFGMEKEDFVVKKPVSISSVLPRFVISEDKLMVGALVHNQSGNDVKTKVELKAAGFDIKGSDKKSLFIKNGESKRVDWEITVKPVNADSTLTVEFKSPEDTVEYKLPVKTFAFPEVVSVNGLVKDKYSETVQIPSDVAANMGGLNIRVSGSLLVNFIKQFEALKDYPYGCAEQITSKILPTLILKYQSAKQKDVDLFKLLNLDIQKSDKIVSDTLQKISKFQRFDGSYGFWEGAKSGNTILTSYVLYSQYLAQKSGFTVSLNGYNLAIQYLWKILNSKDTSVAALAPNEKAFVLWVLSEAGKNDTGMTLSLYEKRAGLSLYAQALMLMNLENLYNAGQKSVQPYIAKLKAEIVSKQIVKDRIIHFEEVSNSWWDLNTDRRTTAMILMALNRDSKSNPILPNIVNYLTSSQAKGYIINTQETAWILMAMLEYAESQNALKPDLDLDVKLNNQSILSGKIAASNIAQIFEKQIQMSDLKTGANVNDVSFENKGKTQMLYDMELKYYLPNEKIQPIEKGFSITRNYYEFDSGSSKPVKTMQSGKIYRGELNIIVPENMYYAVVEERLPAGFEAINFNLDTTDTSLQYKLQKQTQPKGEYYWYDNPLWYFNYQETRDDRVLLSADYLPKGVYTYSFLVRAGLPGFYHHLPAAAYQMYFPEVFGRTEGEIVEIK